MDTASYTKSGLDFTRRVEKTILKSSSSDNPAEPSRKSIYSVKLDSRTNIDNWKKRINPEEIDRIWRRQQKLLPFFIPIRSK